MTATTEKPKKAKRAVSQPSAISTFGPNDIPKKRNFEVDMRIGKNILTSVKIRAYTPNEAVQMVTSRIKFDIKKGKDYNAD